MTDRELTEGEFAVVGPGWKHHSTIVHQLTMDAVRHIAGMPHFDGDRSLDSADGLQRQEWLAHKLDSGRFFSPRWAVTLFEGEWHRMNGGNSTRTLMRRGSVPDGMVYILDSFSCDSWLGMADLFDQFDPKLSHRTDGDRLAAHRAVEPALAESSKKNLRDCLGGVAQAVAGFTCVDAESQFLLFHNHAPFMAWAASFVKKPYARSRGVVAAMFEQYQAYPLDKTSITAFWHEVVTQSNPDNKHPTRVLREFLDSQVGLAQRRKAPIKTVAIKCIIAWNAAKRGVYTSLRVRGDKLPKVL